MDKPKILIIDDEPELQELLSLVLSKNGFTPYTASSGAEGLRNMYKIQPDLILLDIMMPDTNGWEITKRIRQITDVPIIIISAMAQKESLVLALKNGADDYLTKPFHKVELIARIEALLRRTQKADFPIKNPGYDDGYLKIDREGLRVFREGQPVSLTAIEHQLLLYLYKNKGRICANEMILQNVWGGDTNNGSKYIHVYIWRIRKKLEKDPKKPFYIVTDHGIGYHFEPNPALSQDLKGLYQTSN